MTLSIRDKADTVGTFRAVTVHLMETLSAWVPSTPELEIKTLFGRHIWDLAQHADQLGKRTSELRAPLHYDRAPVAAYASVLDRLRAARGTGERVTGFYDAVLPDLDARYRRHLAAADPLLDHPTVRIIEHILFDIERVAREREETRAGGFEPAATDPAWAGALAAEATAVDDFVEYREPVATPAEAG